MLARSPLLGPIRAGETARVPRASGMSSSETLGEWLARVGLARLEPIFRDNGIDLDVAPLLTDAELKELGLTLGDRKRVLSAAAMLGESHTAIFRLRPERAVATRIEGERR